MNRDMKAFKTIGTSKEIAQQRYNHYEKRYNQMLFEVYTKRKETGKKQRQMEREKKRLKEMGIEIVPTNAQERIDRLDLASIKEK